MYGLALVCEVGLAFASLKVISSTETNNNVNAYQLLTYRYHGRPSVRQHLTADIASFCSKCVP